MAYCLSITYCLYLYLIFFSLHLSNKYTILSCIKIYYSVSREFNGQEDQHSVELCSTNVTIIPSPGDHDHGSSKVKLKNIVDFTWDHHLYTGQLLAVHVSGKYLAYGIKGNT